MPATAVPGRGSSAAVMAGLDPATHATVPL